MYKLKLTNNGIRFCVFYAKNWDGNSTFHLILYRVISNIQVQNFSVNICECSTCFKIATFFANSSNIFLFYCQHDIYMNYCHIRSKHKNNVGVHQGPKMGRTD